MTPKAEPASPSPDGKQTAAMPSGDGAAPAAASASLRDEPAAPPSEEIVPVPPVLHDGDGASETAGTGDGAEAPETASIRDEPAGPPAEEPTPTPPAMRDGAGVPETAGPRDGATAPGTASVREEPPPPPAEQATPAPPAPADGAGSPATATMRETPPPAPRNGARPEGLPVSKGTRDGDALLSAAAEDDGKLFPTAPIIELQKGFWIRIFTEIPSDEGLLHDRELTLPVYEHVRLGDRSPRAQRSYLAKRIRHIQARLRQLSGSLKRGEPLDEEARELLAKLPKGVTPKEIRVLAGGLRFQRGLADRFRRGLIRSGAVLKEIRRILVEHGVPADISFLPHVESSFNLRTHSKFGAAGIWQFTRGTGKKFLKVRYEVDERLDPILATYAAAKFMRANYDRLGTWPLAITAYNHGPQGIERIVTKKRTHDLGTLIETCDCRLFRFASKNFYAEFLAAREVARHYERYFGPLELDPELAYQEVPLPFYLDFEKAIEVLGVGEQVLRDLNPSLRTPVIVGAKLIPMGYKLRIPADVKPAHFVSQVPKSDRHAKQKLTEVVRVQRGDTLYDLGRRYNVPWSEIARANQITAYHRIRPGQRLVIPRRSGRSGKWIARAPVTPAPKPVRKVAAHVPATTGAALPVAATAGETVGSIAFQRAEGTMLFQDLEVQRVLADGTAGEIIAAYGETLGHYAEWAGVSTQDIRDRNRFGYGSLLQPGRRVVVPFGRTKQQEFTQARFEYHRGREEDFYSTYGVTELIQVKVRRGDSVWQLAQSNNIPMWLFYQQNPQLVNAPMQAGMTVGLPVIEELATLRKAPPDEDGAKMQ